MHSLHLMEQLCRPLGIGYDDYPAFVRRYIHPADAVKRTPDLGMSLAALGQAGAFPFIDSRLGASPSCLIQGITSPRNGTYLREFLQSRGAADPQIHAIDIVDVASVLATMAVPLPDVRFSVANATWLPAFRTGSMQLLVQDHLLNCTPHRTHEAIIREAARLLDPHGFLILNFSVHPRASAKKLRTRFEIEAMLRRPLNDQAYCLSDLLRDPDELDQYKMDLIGETIELEDPGRLIVITAPAGNFEFYFEKSELEQRLSRHGLCFGFVTCERGFDSTGVSCLRYRTLVHHRD